MMFYVICYALYVWKVKTIKTSRANFEIRCLAVSFKKSSVTKKSIPFLWYFPAWYLQISRFFQDLIWIGSKFQIFGPYGLTSLSPALNWFEDSTLRIVSKNAEAIFKCDFVISFLDNCSFCKKLLFHTFPHYCFPFLVNSSLFCWNQSKSYEFCLLSLKFCNLFDFLLLAFELQAYVFQNDGHCWC